ncbi:MmyB family transcriptional regulator [Streptomyces sp. NPDC001492]
MNVTSDGGEGSLLLTRILRQARARRNTSDIPGFTSMFGTGFARGITQDQTAQLAGVSRRWYNSLESGRPANYSDGFLHRIRAVLALDDDEWVIVYRIARGRSPAATLASPPNQLLPPALLALVEQSKTWGIYLSDQRWDVLACNEKIQEYFPWMGSGPNVVEWVLTWPGARAQLINWQTDWALPTIAALRVNAEQWPNDERLQEVIKTVRLDPTVCKLWNAPDLPAVIHPASSSPRRLYLPQQEDKEFAIRIVSLTPMEVPACRLIAITPAELVSTG